jgi:RNA-directed DNA polymerase
VHSNEENVITKLHRIAEKASKDKRCQFTSLFHLMNKPFLLECFMQLNGKSASGIDNITKERYAMNLEANLDDLVKRLHQMSYRPQPVLRVYIPKPGSNKRRPLGIPTLEDKLVQAGLVKILQAIYEQDFVDDSYGFRPARNCHDALRALNQTVEKKPIHYIVEADIKGSIAQSEASNTLCTSIGSTFLSSSIRCLIAVWLDSSSFSAIPARMGFKST